MMRTMHIIGDSTVENQYRFQYGWGGQIADFLPEGWQVANHAIGGRSSRSFWEEGRFEPVRAAMRPGDLLLIAFGHNDATIQKPERYADAETVFPLHLRRYVRGAREAGATPVLVTCVARRSFDAQGRFVHTHGRYPQVTREVAAAEGVPLIDLKEMTKARLIELGPEASGALYVRVLPGAYDDLPEGREDTTHFSLEGARMAAEMAVQTLARLGLV